MVTVVPGFGITHTLMPPINTTVQRGGAVGPFYASITNRISSSYTFWFNRYTIAPDGTTDTVSSLLRTIDAGAAHYAGDGYGEYVYVPQDAPIGKHSHCTKLNDESLSELIAQDCFDFYVVP